MQIPHNGRSSEQAESPAARPSIPADEWNRIADRSFEIGVELFDKPTVITRTYAYFGSNTGSVKIFFDGPHKGTWKDFGGTPPSGDMVALIRRERGLSFIAAREFALKERLPSPVAVKQKAKPAQADYDKVAFAREQWFEARTTYCTIAETYLTKHRGIPLETVRALDRAGRIRFHPRHKSKPDDRWPAPALLVLATDLAGNIQGFQAVRLNGDGSKRSGLAKLSAGSFTNAQAIGWLSSGDSDIISGEGPEDAITVYAARPDAMVGAAFGGLKRLVDSLPPPPRRVILAAQNDNQAKDSAKLFLEACELLTAAGYDVWIARPPADLKDANDLLRRDGIEAVRAMLDAAQPFSPPPDQPGEKFERCEPSFTAPTTTANEASTELAATFQQAWHGDILPAVHRYRDWSAEAAAAERDGVTAPDQPLMPQIGLAPGMGVGKTEVLIKAPLSTPDIRMALFAPSHAVASDVDRRVKSIAADGSAVWSGIERPDPQAPGCTMCRRLKTVKTMMASGGSASDLCGTRRKGFCWHHPESGCAASEVCGTQRQNREMAESQARVILMPHAMITNPAPAALKREPVTVPFAGSTVSAEQAVCDVVAIDESPWLSMVQVRKARIPLVDLNRAYVDEWRVPAREGEEPSYPSRRLRELSIKAHDALAEAQDKTARVRVTKSMFGSHSAPLTAEMCFEAHGLTWRLHIDPASQVRPDMNDEDVIRTLQPIIGHNRAVRRMARLWKTLGEFLNSSEDQSAYLTLTAAADDEDDEEETELDDPEAVPEKKAAKKYVPSIALSWRDEIHPDWLQGPVVYADGTMNETLTRYWLPKLDVISRAQAATPKSVTRRQVLDRPVSHHQVCPRNTDTIDKNEKTRRNHAVKLARLLELRQHQFKGRGREIVEADGTRTRIDVGFVVPMRLETYWRDNSLIPNDPAVEVHHQNNVRGLTRLEVVSCLSVVSRPLPAPPVTEEIAWVISGRVGECLPAGQWYPTRDAGALMRDGSGRRVRQEFHPDPLAEAVRWQICEAEVLQNEARARAVRRDDSTPLVIDIVTSVPLPLEIDEVVAYDDIVDEVDPVSMSVARGMVAFDWQGVGLVCRDLFRGSNDLGGAARKWASRNPGRRKVLEEIRERLGGGVTNSLYIDSYKGVCHRGGARFRVYKYQFHGDETVRQIAISDEHADPLAALEKVTGSLQMFEGVELQPEPGAVEPAEHVLDDAAADRPVAPEIPPPPATSCRIVLSRQWTARPAELMQQHGVGVPHVWVAGRPHDPLVPI